MIDLSTTISNTHISTLRQQDLKEWAREAETLERCRDFLDDRLRQIADQRDDAIEAFEVERSEKRAWRFTTFALGLAWVAAVLVSLQ